MKYIPALDGLRAIAIVIVVVSHLTAAKWIPGGFGVTLFFLISGYLITTLLCDEFRSTGTIAILPFYVRRFRRLMPALVFMIAVVSLAAAACLKPPPLSEICAALLYAMNYYILAGGEGLPFGTLWSLAVEEHFYLIFPVMVLACLRFRERFLLALLTACVAILFWRILLVYQGAPSDRTYLATDTRIDSILWGCILAVAMDLKVNLEWLTKKSVIGLAVVGLLASLAIRNPAFRETLRYTLQGMCLLPLFVVAIARPPRVAAILESAPMLWIGKRSYSLYLWHFPIIFLIGEQFPHVSPWLTGAVAGMMSLALAAFSYSFVENRYRVKHVNSLAAAAAPAR